MMIHDVHEKHCLQDVHHVHHDIHYLHDVQCTKGTLYLQYTRMYLIYLYSEGTQCTIRTFDMQYTWMYMMYFYSDGRISLVLTTTSRGRSKIQIQSVRMIQTVLPMRNAALMPLLLSGAKREN